MFVSNENDRMSLFLKQCSYVEIHESINFARVPWEIITHTLKTAKNTNNRKQNTFCFWFAFVWIYHLGFENYWTKFVLLILFCFFTLVAIFLFWKLWMHILNLRMNCVWTVEISWILWMAWFVDNVCYGTSKYFMPLAVWVNWLKQLIFYGQVIFSIWH